MNNNRLNYLEQLLLDDEHLTYGVYWGGKGVFAINKRLMAQQGVTYENISLLHVERVGIEKDMEWIIKNRAAVEAIEPKLSNKFLKALYLLWVVNQHKLQDEWNFGINDNFIKFWSVPGCTCPKMDNNDRWPSGYYVKDLSCPIHGD